MQQSENTQNIKQEKVKHSIVTIFKNKKLANILLVIALLFILIFACYIRLLNLPLLKDVTTNKYIPLALDPFYFLRVAKLMLNGSLPDYDAMRYPAAKVGFTHEIMPRAIVFFYKLLSTFDKDITIEFVDVILPVIFFVLGMFVFFFLIMYLTKSKLIALLSTAFLSFSPAYLYRTMAGFSDHEAIGMFAFFLTLLCYAVFIDVIINKQIKNKAQISQVWFSIVLGFALAILSSFTIASWGGIANFVFMIIPLSFLLIWLVINQPKRTIKSDLNKRLLIFYASWLLFSIVITKLYGYSFSVTLNKILLGSNVMLTGFVFVFTVIDYFLLNRKNKGNLGNLEQYRPIISFIITLVIGFSLLAMAGKNPITILSDIKLRLLHPFGLGRVSLTVAENQQPYLVDWIAQTGKLFFWLFFAGMFVIGIEIAKLIKQNKNKIAFSLVWLIMLACLIFSRISARAVLNGENAISQFVYFFGLVVFLAYAVWVYFKDDIKLNTSLAIIASWAFFMLISARGAIRLFFVITPLVCFSASFFIVKVFDYAKTNKDELAKILLWIVVVFTVIGLLISFADFVSSSKLQAKHTAPSANLQWQKAMAWVRNNTQQDAIFVHWWDYGYWVEYLGQRPAVTDGGHAVGYWDHLIGRYVLTTPNPETALSFMKSHNVSYLLIDPTDIGKYSAYSKIGSDETGEDRFSWITTFNLDEKQTYETANATYYVYVGGTLLDDDFVYNSILIPKQKAVIAGFVMPVTRNGSIQQPYAVVIFKDKQIKIPIAKVWLNGQLYSFTSNQTMLDGCLYIIPSIQNNKLKTIGSALWLSSKVFNSLFAQLYLFNGTLLNQYKDAFVLVHSQQDPVIEAIKQQQPFSSDLLNYYGLRGPIKIWKINYPDSIIARPEFVKTRGEWAELDGLQFTS